MANGNQHGGSRHGQRSQYDQPKLDTTRIKLKKQDGKALDPDIFNRVAADCAKVIAQNNRQNKPSQLRKFYDELVMWHEKVRQSPERFDEILPFIRMLNAKAAYAQGRKNVDTNFTLLINDCIRQVDSVETLDHFKLFFEAFLGFYKLENPKG